MTALSYDFKKKKKKKKTSQVQVGLSRMAYKSFDFLIYLLDFCYSDLRYFVIPTYYYIQDLREKSYKWIVETIGNVYHW